jgi:hypothetical protein
MRSAPALHAQRRHPPNQSLTRLSLALAEQSFPFKRYGCVCSIFVLASAANPSS